MLTFCFVVHCNSFFISLINPPDLLLKVRAEEETMFFFSFLKKKQAEKRHISVVEPENQDF